MKKLVTLLLSGLLIVSTVPTSSFAAVNSATDKVVPIAIKGEQPQGGTTQDPSDLGLESAIKAIKTKITIPSEYSDFNYYFYNTNSYVESFWNLTWKNPNNNSYIQISCDKDYHIMNYTKYEDTQSNLIVSQYLKKELKATADSFIKQIAPDIYSSLEYMDASYNGVYSGNYVYRYVRKENGVVFPDNAVNISVNNITGEVTSASISWLYNEKVPSSTVKLTKEEAAKILKDHMKMKLVYRSNNIIYYDSKIASTDSKKAFLVYEPSENYISVDAKTGKVYLTSNQWIDRNAGSSYEKSAQDTASVANGSSYNQLTEQEASKVAELKNLISKETAVKKVTGNKYLLMDKSLTNYTTTLNKVTNANGKDTYTWNINFNDPRPVNYEKDADYYRAYASASVDAKTGKILSFYASVKNYYDQKNQKWNTVKVPYNKEKARAVLEKFLNSEAKTYFNSSILSMTNDDYVAYYKNNVPVYGGYSYQYNRTYEGIEYPYNGIYGSVDGVSGKVYAFSTNWDDSIVFESSKGAMTPEKAMDYYLSNDGFGLQYEINTINSYDSGKQISEITQNPTEYEVRLVYRPDINPSYISPFTGEQLNYNGEVYKEAKPYQYLDVTDTPENREILLLADMNIGFEGDYFKPNSEITLGEVNSLLEKIGYGYLLLDSSDSNKLITREEMAHNMIVKLGLEKMSGLKGIYKTGYIDENTINPEYLGAVAIAKGLGLMGEDANNYFHPLDNITRAEAVHLILNYIQIQYNGLNY